MKKELPTVLLGIDPGARQIGVSVFRAEELIFYAVKSIKNASREESLFKLRRVLEELIRKYKIEFAAVEKVVFVQQHRSFVKIVYDEIRSFFKRQHIRLIEYNPKFIKKAVCGLHKPTKRNAALVLSQKHPELARYFNVPRLWQRTYYAQLFDAIAVGQVGVEELADVSQLTVKTAKNSDVQ